MPRIAYLTKRGNIWWFRRRHPAIFVSTPQNHLKSDVCFENGTKAQASGHIAISLQTASKREARQLSALISADFERAWGFIEANMAEANIEQDLLDALAMAITQSCRQHIGVLRSSAAASQDPRVKERAYRILEEELRSSLGVTSDNPQPSSKPTVSGSPVASTNVNGAYDGTCADNPDDIAAIQTEMEEYERTTLLSHIGPEARTNDDYYAEHLINEFGVHTLAFRATFSEYLDACERLNVDPRTATPDFEIAIKEALQAAEELGLAQDEAAKFRQKATRSGINTQLAKQKFSEFAKDYLVKRCSGLELRHEDETPDEATGARFERTSLRNWQSSVRVFTEIVGDLPLADYGKDEVLDFNNLVQRLPSNFGKSSKDKRSARDVIEETDHEEERQLPLKYEELIDAGLPEAEIEDKIAEWRVRRISANTMKRHQTALSSIFRHALELGAVKSNPFKGRTLTTAQIKNRQKGERRVERVGWGDHSYTLFGSEKFQTPLEDLGDPLFWAPIIATYTGMRMEEISQLRLGDFATEDGIPYLAVQNALGTQSIKSDNGIRKIPLHQALIDLGLLKLVEKRSSVNMSRLFPQIERSKSKGTFSGLMSKNFAYYLKSRGIKEPGLDFHALRTDFLTRLTRARVPDHVRKGLMGHEQTDVTHRNYFRAGERMEDPKEYIDRVDVDHIGIRHPFGVPDAKKPIALRVVSGS